MTVIDGSVPSKFANLGIQLYKSGSEWSKGFDSSTSTIWNAVQGGVPNYLFITFDDNYLLRSMELAVRGDGVHDPKIIELYSDQNAECLMARFSYEKKTSAYTFPTDSLSNLNKSIVAKYLLINIAQRWTTWQTWLARLRFYGIPY